MIEGFLGSATDRETGGPVLEYLVLRTGRMGELKAFFELLGLQFQREKHGRGPVHFSARLNSFIFELYPLRPNECPEKSLRLGFQVVDLAQVLDGVAELGLHVDRRVGNRVTVRGPEGRVYDLMERAAE